MNTIKSFLLVLSIGLLMGCSNDSNSKSAQDKPSHKSALIHQFVRMVEPREKAFSVLVPKGWSIQGGIFRVDPNSQGGAAQSVAAKVDFAVVKDAQSSVMIRWLPDMLYYDARYSPAGQMGMFPQGSNYNGMTVYNLMTPQQFISKLAFPYAHKNALNVKVTENKNLNQLASQMTQASQKAMPQMTFSYNAGLQTLVYEENSVEYVEKMLTIIENWGQMGAGMWGNKETVLIRAPKKEFSTWEPVFSIIQNSIKIDRKWLSQEIRGQMQRANTINRVMQDMAQIERSITEHKQKTNAEIHNDMFLTLTDQEEYVNPFTKEVETGSNQWRHRWTNPNGDVIYTDDESYDPRTDIHLNRTDYKKSAIRKRFGE